ncbi:ArsR/SmtB family transcription factor [Litoreibacter arenae]|uniref:Transcriptional regulator, ArsR family n=1 Tax=Litoreibacter arenae DSM 19593 TaxID=1123360 RepID=S9RQ90_9RHOB|nr:winged helix-turn-helix domain-containing protein [Litoreibacter arenae]EPX80230.1 Transcriptional regulator, ArsR family [Litoreibacter arenae DSM 19593]
MKDGPDIARIANLIGDPGRANMLAALMSGKALTAGELASEAGIRGQTASGHLTRLEEGGLIQRDRQGRHHYFRLADGDVAQVLEALMGLAAKNGQLRTRTGPRDPELRHARVCYNHLAGNLGVLLYDGLKARGVLVGEGDDIALSDAGRAEMAALGIDLSAKSRSPECKSCLDWSARRSHLAGRLGRGILDHMFAQGWASRPEGTRIVRFTGLGEAAFRKAFNF